jgi:hypothetical protein
VAHSAQAGSSPRDSDHLAAQEKFGHGRGTDETEQGDQQRRLEIGVAGVTDAQHQHHQHGQQVQVVQRQHPILGGWATEQAYQGQQHGQAEDQQAGENRIGQ